MKPNPGVQFVITFMRRGGLMCCGFKNGRKQWWLSNGAGVTSDVAKAVENHPCVVGARDSLFTETPSQTFYYLEATYGR